MSKKNFAMSYISEPGKTAADSPAVSDTVVSDTVVSDTTVSDTVVSGTSVKSDKSAKSKTAKSAKPVREKSESRADLQPAFRADAAETKSRRVQLLLKPSDYDKLAQAAKSSGVSVNRVIEEMIAKLL